MHDLTVIKQQDLPSAEKLSTYFLDLAAEIQLQVKNCDSIRQLAWKILGSIPNQYKTVYIVCDTYKINSIKSGERMLRGDGKVYIL